MKRFLIFLLCIVGVLALFLILAINFKALGLYIALLVLAIVFLLAYSLMVFVAIKVRHLNRLIQDIELEKALKEINYLKRLSFSMDEQMEMKLYQVMIYSLLDMSDEASNIFITINKKNMKSARLLNLYFSSERLLYLSLKDEENYKQSVEEFMSLAVNPDVILINEMNLGLELIRLSQAKYSRVKVEDIKDNLDFSSFKPKLVQEFYDLFSNLVEINDDLKYRDENYSTPLCSNLLNDLKTTILNRLSY